MAEKTLGPEFLIHGGGLDLVFPHHENERAQSQAVGRPFAKIWMHNGLLRFTGEKMSKSVGNVATIQEVIAEWGREVALLFLMTGHWRKPSSFGGGDEGGRRAGREPANALRGETRSVGTGTSLPPLSMTTSTRRLRLRSSIAGRARGRSPSCGEGSPCSGWASSVTPLRLRRDRRSGPCPRGGPCGTRLRRVGPPSRRDRGRRLGGAGRQERARGLRARATAVTRELIYGRNAVREALRGRREVLELWVSERAAASLEWLGEGPRPQITKERDLTEAAGSPDHQGVVAWASPYPYADPWELAAGPMPLLACLDQVTDPRNLGAVVRSAAGAGATGVIVPAHGAAQVTPAVCRSSAGTVEHLPVAVVPNLARYLAEIKRDDLWSYAATADAPQTMWQADLTGGVALVFGAEGKGVRPLVRKTCDSSISIPLAAGVESLNVSVAAAVLLYEARRQRGAGAGGRTTG